MKIINGQHIYKSFYTDNEKNTVLQDVSVAISQGEFVSIMGPSGSGKSTLLYALSGMDTIDSGEVFFGKQSLTTCSENTRADLRRQKMGFVFQQPVFLKNLTIIDNILLPARRDNLRNKELVGKAEKLLEKTRIGQLAKRMTHQVSGGQLQRAGICRVLINDPIIIYGDEPTGALNSKAAEEIMEIFLQINQAGTTILLVTHDAKVAAQSERILFMRDGQLIEQLHLGKFTHSQLEKRTEQVTKKMLQVEI